MYRFSGIFPARNTYRQCHMNQDASRRNKMGVAG